MIKTDLNTNEPFRTLGFKAATIALGLVVLLTGVPDVMGQEEGDAEQEALIDFNPPPEMPLDLLIKMVSDELDRLDESIQLRLQAQIDIDRVEQVYRFIQAIQLTNHDQPIRPVLLNDL